jgi:hypothetical protein
MCVCMCMCVYVSNQLRGRLGVQNLSVYPAHTIVQLYASEQQQQ